MIDIRPIREEDATGFHQVLDAICRERRFLAMLQAPPVEAVKGFVGNNIKNGHSQFVAIDGEQVVGWCDVIPGHANMGTAHIGQLGMGVGKEHRRHGIGRKLAIAAIEKAKANGLLKIELSVFASNESAIALYRSLGFVEEGRKSRGRLVDGIYDDIVLMARML